MRYRRLLENVPGISVMPVPPETSGNASYFPVFVSERYPISRDALYQRLKDEGINGRRYFYPLISDMPMYRGLPTARSDNLPNATMLAQQVLCLPIYADLELSVVDEACRIIAGVHRG
jgi:dTDP-4-amino-4,6-dideoxygalactose transaminase